MSLPQVRYHQFLVSKELGGAGLVAFCLAQHLMSLGESAPVWLPRMGAAFDEARHLGLDARTYNYEPATDSSTLRAAWTSWRIRRALSRQGPGIVHVHSTEVYGALRWGLRARGLKCIVHVHIQQDVDFLRWVFRLPPDLIITCARSLVDGVRAALPLRAQNRQWIEAVPNAIDLDRYSPGDRGRSKQSFGLAARPHLLMLANLAPHKGQETAIRAVALLKQRGIDVSLSLAGTERGGATSYTTQLRGIVSGLAVADRVRFLGQRRDVPDLLRAADFLLLPSTQEGLPLAVLEAQAAKVVVLAAPTAGIPDVVRDGRTGYLIAAADAEGYAARITELIHDPAAYERIAADAYALVSTEHSQTRFCSRVRDLYTELLSRDPAMAMRRATQPSGSP